MNKNPDNILLEKLKKGNNRAFEEVYEDNREKFLNFGYQFNLTKDDLLDIYQDAYIILYENIMIGKLTTLSSSISTYLISIGKYKILDRLRKNKKVVHNHFLSQKTIEETTLMSFEMENESLTKNEVLLKKYFDELGEKCKAILIMFYYKKYSIKEIVAEGNYNSENVAKSQKSRCLKTLRHLCKNATK